LINGGLCFQFANHASQRRAIVMQFRFLHSPLTIRIIEKLEHCIEWLFRIVEDVSVGFSL
jgi:hypothetical protein